MEKEPTLIEQKFEDAVKIFVRKWKKEKENFLFWGNREKC